MSPGRVELLWIQGGMWLVTANFSGHLHVGHCPALTKAAQTWAAEVLPAP